MNKPKDVDEYIASFPPDIQQKLSTLRATINAAAPDTQEVISYGMPAFKQHGVLVYFAAGKNHIGFYPTGEPIKHFKEELAVYKTSKGAVQFPLDKPLPVALITKMVKFRIEQDHEHAAMKKMAGK